MAEFKAGDKVVSVRTGARGCVIATDIKGAGADFSLAVAFGHGNYVYDPRNLRHADKTHKIVVTLWREPYGVTCHIALGDGSADVQCAKHDSALACKIIETEIKEGEFG
jgi:hypothetical protein